MIRRNIKNWASVFKGFGNVNRLKILEVLTEKKEASVSELCDRLDISFKNTSRNLSILSNLGIVEYKGKEGRVFYSINGDLDGDVGVLLKLFCKK